MKNEFDELTKSMAQSVTRRQAMKKFGLGLAGMALACFGLANKADAAPKPSECLPPNWCNRDLDPCCCRAGRTKLPTCDPLYSQCIYSCQVTYPH